MTLSPEEKIKNLEVMTQPVLWAMRPMLPLRKPNEIEPLNFETGVLVESAMGRFLWVPGASIAESANSVSNEKAMQNATIILAPVIEDLLDAGWEVDW